MQKWQWASGSSRYSRGAKNAGDEVWVARYLAERNAEVWPLYRVAPEATGADRLERIWHARELLRYDPEDLWRISSTRSARNSART